MTVLLRSLILSAILLFTFSPSLLAKETFVAASALGNTGLRLRIDSDRSALAKTTSASALAIQTVSLADNDGRQHEFWVAAVRTPNRNLPLITSFERIRGAAAPNATGESAIATEAFATEPVLVRGRWLAKLYIPADVAAGALDLEFSGEPELRKNTDSGPVDRLIDGLVVNAEQESAWTIRKSPVAAEVYNPFAQSSNWLRIAITQSGLYKITRADLANAGVNVGALDPRSLRLFHAGGRPLPVFSSAIRDSLREMAILVDGESDGSLGDNDQIMFYANGGDFWDWRSEPQYVRHPYSDRNVYYLSYGGTFAGAPLRIATAGVDEVNASDTLTRFFDRLHFEQDAVFASSGGDVFDYFNWYWGIAGDLTAFVNLPQPAPLANSVFRVRATRPSFNLRLNNFEIARDSSNGSLYYYTSNRFVNGINQFNLDFPFNDGYTDYLEIYLERSLAFPDNGELLIHGQSDGLPHAYKVSGSFQSAQLFDITDIFAQRRISATPQGNTLAFSAAASAGAGRVFQLANSAAVRTPFSIVVTQIDDIRSAANGADYIIIVHDNFAGAADAYADYRESSNQLRTRVVKISDIYAQFSGGRVDPLAIRQFLRHAYANWNGAAPSYCLLAGDGVYDFRNNLGTGAVNFIPPYIADRDETVSDENFAYLDSLDLDDDDSYPADRGVDMVIARWPVKTAAEFQTVFNKIKGYDESRDPGPWHNIITLIADDENHPQSNFPEIFHTTDTEILSKTSLPPTFVQEKIYGIAYPFGSASEKPLMREAIISAINTGRLIVNYTGHGNQNLWADERIFRRVQDIPRLTNSDRLPLIFNASCSIGFFDDPRSEGMAEDLLRYAAGGAVGTISATRLVYSRPNFEFNKAGMEQLLSDKNYTIAEAMFVTKLLRQGAFGVGDNDRKYIYIGDPLTRLAQAPNKLDYSLFRPDSLVALTVTELAGQVTDRDGVTQTQFDGTLTLSVFDNERTRSIDIPPFTIDYQEYGPEIYRGRVGVADGAFSLKFVVPKDISYGGRQARINGYASSTSSGAAGVIYPIAIGSINKEVTDSIGPEIAVTYGAARANLLGSTVNPNTVIAVELFDSLGINLSGEVGHGIELTIDERAEFRYELTDSFSYFSDSYQRGSASMQLPELTGGSHTLKIKAWDSANNSRLQEVAFSVSSDAALVISDLLAYPNPVAEACEFSYALSDEARDVTLKLFTLSGLEIWSQSGLPGARGNHQGISWNGRDADGDRIANGVYIFQLSARRAQASLDGLSDDNKVEATGKLVVLK